MGAVDQAASGGCAAAAPGSDAAGRFAGAATAGEAQAGAEAGAKPLRKRRKRAGRERETPGGDLLLLGGLRRILADTPSPTARPPTPNLLAILQRPMDACLCWQAQDLRWAPMGYCALLHPARPHAYQVGRACASDVA